MKDGTEVTIRPIRPEDEPLMVKFHETLSERSVYLRYFHMIKLSQRIAHERLTRICFIDYDREMALVADHKNPQTDEHEILGIGRLTKQPGTEEAQFAILVADPVQGTRTRQRTAEEDYRHRARGEDSPHHRRNPARQLSHAEALRTPGLPPGTRRRRRRRQGAD